MAADAIERQQAEAERDHYRDLFDSAPCSYLVTDAQGVICEVNRAACLLLEQSSAQLVGVHLDSYLPGEEVARFHQVLGAMASGTGTYDLEVRLIPPGREPFYALLMVAPDHDSKGKLITLRWLVRDITARKRVEEALRASEERFRLVLENSRDIIFQRNLLTERYDYFSPVVESLAGYTVDEVVTMGPEQTIALIHPEDRANYVARARAIITSSEPLPTDIVEYRWLTRSGVYRWFSMSRRLVRDNEGRAVALVGTIRDVHEQKMAEEALRLSEERFRLVLAHSPITVSMMDTDLRYTWVHNPVLPLAADAFIGKRADDMMPAESVADLSAFRQVVLESGVSGRREVQVPFPDGPRWYDMAIEPLRNAAGEIVGIANVAIDITTRKRAEQELQELNRTLEARVAERTAELEQRNEQLRLLASEITQTEQRERRELARVLHDDLQQLLVAAQLCLHSLHGRLSDATLTSQVKQAEELIKQSIQTSRSLTAQLSPPVLHEMGLAPALEWLVQWIAHHQHLMVELQVEPQAEPQEESIRVLLFECVRELLLNVVKHAGVDRAQLVMARGSDDMIEIIVSDAGPGFDVARVYADRRLAGGFGLFSVRERLSALGGTMTVQSGPGSGTHITLRAPRSRVGEGASRSPNSGLWPKESLHS